VKPYCANRLTVVGRTKEIARFKTKYEPDYLGLALLENSRTRVAWQFETGEPPISEIIQLSTLWHSLVLLLDYDREDRRIKGLVRAKAGALQHHLVRY
jgi:hypothetical protein